MVLIIIGKFRSRNIRELSICDDDVNLEADSLIRDRRCTKFYVQLLIHFDFHDDGQHTSVETRARMAL